MQYTLVGSEDGSANITVFVPGQAPMVAHSSHPNYDAIVEGALAGDDAVIDLFDVSTSAAQKFERLSDRVSVANGRVYLDHEEVNNALTAQVVRFIKEGVEDWKPLVRFFENVQANPNEHSREQLYNWLSKRDFTITDDGLIVGYKGVFAATNAFVDQTNGYVFYSINKGKAIVNGEVKEGAIPQKLGDVVEMPRNEVTHDPSVGCHQGLHVGTYDYANDFAQGALLEVHVNPRDVVSVPTDSDWAKMRVCRYVVVDTIDAPYTTSVLDRREDDDWDDDFWGDGEDWDDFEGDLGYEAADKDSVEYSSDPNPAEKVDDLDADPNRVVSVVTRNGTEVAVCDTFEDTDKRRTGRTFHVTSIEGDYAVGKSYPQNVTRKIRLDRLTSRKYRKA